MSCRRQSARDRPIVVKKRIRTRYGSVELANSHGFLEGASHFRLSPYIQELMVYAGHLDAYVRGSDIIEKFLRVDTNTSQIYRVTNYYGQKLSPLLYTPSAALAVDATEVIYAEIDGSMIFTDKYAALNERLVFVVDGAVWIHRWICETYPAATQILDFYHASEHLGEFARQAISDARARSIWMARQKARLLAGGVERVIASINRMAVRDPELAEGARTLIEVLSE